jgi:hypothetical protein
MPMPLTLTSTWYTAGSFWVAVATGLVGLIIGALTVVFTARGGREARRRLVYGMTEVTPLLKDFADINTELEVRHEGKIVNAPYLVELFIGMRGNRDILASDYDQGKALQLDLGVSIVRMLKKESLPDGVRFPDYTITDTRLEIGPSLIVRGQDISFSLLVDGIPNLRMESSISAAEPQRIEDVERKVEQYGLVLDVAAASIPGIGGIASAIALSIIKQIGNGRNHRFNA